MAEAHKDRDVLMNTADMCCLPVGPCKSEDILIEDVRVWASTHKTNGGGFQIFKESRKPAGKIKGPRRLLMCEKSGKVKPSNSNNYKPIQHTKKCECTWGVWIEQSVEGWTTVELPKKARELLIQPGATMATVHNHPLMLSVADMDTNARDSCAGVPPAKKQRTSFIPMSLSAATSFSSRPVPPINK
jgi:hypothetical protein